MPLGDYWPAPVWACLHGVPYGQTCSQCTYVTWTNFTPSGWKCPECSGINGPSVTVCLWCTAKSGAAQAAPACRAPAVGDTVHYVSYGTPGGEYASMCRAAIITEVVTPGGDAPDEIGLCVLNPTGQFFSRNVPFDEGRPQAAWHMCGERTYRGGTWHWPEREGA